MDKGNKTNLLLHLLEDKSLTQVLVFTRTKYGADKVAKQLIKNDIDASAIHGDKSQGARQKALTDFKENNLRVLVATDIAARVIDISELPLVINLDLPNIPENYVHRIGRTGRAGLSGKSISFANFDEIEYLRDIEKLIGQDIPVIKDNPYPMQIFEASEKTTNTRDARHKQPQQSNKSKKKPLVTRDNDKKKTQKVRSKKRY